MGARSACSVEQVVAVVLSPEGALDSPDAPPPPIRVSESERGLGICIFSRFPGDAAAGPETPTWRFAEFQGTYSLGFLVLGSGEFGVIKIKATWTKSRRQCGNYVRRMTSERGRTTAGF